MSAGAASALTHPRKRFRWTGRRGLGPGASSPELDPALEKLFEESRQRLARRMTPKDRRASAAIGGAFFATAVAMAATLPSERSVPLATAAVLVVAYAIASRIEFEVGAGVAVPTELVLIPMLFLLPVGVVPALVATAYLLGAVADWVRGRTHAERGLVLLSASWHSVGPALVLALAGEPEPAWSDWPLYVGALAAQLGFDLASSTARDFLAHGVSPRLALRFLAWVFLVDALLAPIGLLVAFATSSLPQAFLLTLPLMALLALFARERRARIDHALELSNAYRGTALVAETFHEVLSEQGLESLLERIADTLADLIPHDALGIFEADEAQRVLLPTLARGARAERILESRFFFGKGITGWAVEHRRPVLANRADRDPRATRVPGIPADTPTALVVVPLIARGSVKGALNIYRFGDDVAFTEDELHLAQWFADAAALALDNAQIRARLEHQAQTDALTGLYNHRHFHERLRLELARAGRSGEPVAVVMLDVDDFKKVNDVHGHGVGDELLVALADAAKATARASDIVCRLGGDELALIMPACDARAAARVARRLAGYFAARELRPAGPITVSVGVAQAPEHATNPLELVACAEAAMMTAKARGKSAVVVFDDEETERPAPSASDRDDVRSLAHVKMLHSLVGKVNRLNDVRRIGETIVTELRTLVEYHTCRVYLREGDNLIPLASRGEVGPDGRESRDGPGGRMEQRIAAVTAATGESLRIADAARCGLALESSDEIEESMLSVPLRHGAEVVGVVVVSKLGVSQFDEGDQRLLEVLAGHASVALANARLYEAQRREASDANALLTLSGDLAAAEGLDAIVTRVVDGARRVLPAARASVWLETAEGGAVVPRGGQGYAEPDWRRLRTVRLGPAETTRLLERGEPYVADAGGLDPYATRVAIAPLAVDGGSYGCLIVARDDEAFSERTIRLLAAIANQAKLAIAKAGTFDDLERTFLSTVEALANALETSDAYTSSHARAITDLALEVGRELGLDGAALKRLELAALFHDIGKIGIPSEILSKPGPLARDEEAIVKTHPELGERILSPIMRLAEVRPIVRHCHERYDGRGYPDGRAADEIPIESRIILVCDAYDAMTSDRPYRKALSRAEACRRLRAGAGTQFDPDIVDVFLTTTQARGVAAPAGERPASGRGLSREPPLAGAISGPHTPLS